MTTRLLVIGRRPPNAALASNLMDTVARRVRDGDTFIVRRCDTPAALVEIVAEEVARHGKIDILDLYDHGGDGHQRMGDEQLFMSDADQGTPLVGEAIAQKLRTLLTETAHVRLLGCDTSPGDKPTPGRMLLVKLARALGGHRTVFGTISTTAPSDFDEHGLKIDHESELLYSSDAALDYDAPTPDARAKHIADTRIPLH